MSLSSRVSESTPLIIDCILSIGPLILLIFFGMLVFGYVYVYFAIPEVKGLSLEEVDELYRAKVKPWQSAGWKPAVKHLHHHEKGETLEQVMSEADGKDEVREEKPKV